MGITYIDGFQTVASARFATADLDDIYLDEENPRFASSDVFSASDAITQESIINYLIEFADIFSLANKIASYHGLYNEFTISAYIKDGKVVVLEGNRRIAACKVLLNPALVSENIASNHPLPVALPETKANIKKINLIIYGISDDAQKYIASKHTHPDVKKWSTIEQFNYYYSQFKKGKSADNIARSIDGVSTAVVSKKIQQYILFRQIFDILKPKFPHLKVETASILPAITAFMPAITGSGVFGLDLEFDENTLQYKPHPSQSLHYAEILSLIGEAFFVRDKAKKKEELVARPNGSQFLISTDEIKGQDVVCSLIESDIRIPGLRSLINQYKGIFEPALPTFAPTQDALPLPQRPAPALPPSCDGCSTNPDGVSSDSLAEDAKQREKAFASKQKESSFFADLEYKHIDPSNPDNLGLIRVCEEIQHISAYNGHAGYVNFPIASTFLLRSLIEQVIVKQLKKYSPSIYSDLASNCKRGSPDLDAMIAKLIAQCKAANYIPFGGDQTLGRNFLACFDGAGTKAQLDIVIHRPHEISPDKNFLKGLAEQGLKSLIQALIRNF